MGTIKTTNIEPIADNGTVTLGSSGDTFTMPSGVTVAGSMANTPAFLARLSSDQSVSNGTATKISLDGTVYDTASAFASNKFTVPSGQDGTYVLYFSADINAGNHSVVQYVQAMIYKNGSALTNASGADFRNNYGGYTNQVACTIAVPLVATDYIELYMDQSQTSGTPTVKATNSGRSRTYLGGYKLIT